MTMQVGMLGIDGLVIAGDTKRHVAPLWRVWHTYNSSKMKVEISDTEKIAVACAGDMDTALLIANRIFHELPPFTTIQNRERDIREIGVSTTRAEQHGAECITAFAEPEPSLYVLGCDKDGNGRCECVDRDHIGDPGNPAYFLAERHYREGLSVDQLVRLSAHIIVAAGKLNNGIIGGLEIVTLKSGKFHRWSKDENDTLKREITEADKKIEELILGV